TPNLAIDRLPNEAPFCPALKAPRGKTVQVKAGDVEGLLWATKSGAHGSTVLLEDGIYKLGGGQTVEIAVPGLVLRSQSGRRDAVVIEGGYNNITVNVNGVILANVTLRAAREHSVQIRGEMGASHMQVYNVHALDAGQQLIKLSTGDTGSGPYGDHGLVACSLIEYSTYSKGSDRSPPSYTNGIDLLAGKGWVIRDNVFRRIRSEVGPAGPAILVWKNAQDTVIVRNLIVDSWRGIALGLAPADAYSRGGASTPFDHQNGLVANNVILAIAEPGDAAIENNYAANSRVLHNTVFYREGLKHAVHWSIEYRFAPTTAVIRNNLTNLPILKREPLPARDATMASNLTNAVPEWFANLMGEDARLVAGAQAIDRGVPDSEGDRDFVGNMRRIGAAPDIGAYEYDR
ncbi:MAG: choice-of-anchor Q domain-containing protein, partial [Actinomycetota bacterium]